MVRLVNLADGINADESPSSSSSADPKQSSSSSSTSTIPQRWIIRESDNLLINEELVRTGFAYVRGRRGGDDGGGGSSSSSGVGAGSTSSLLDSKLRNDLIMMEQYMLE